MLKREIVWRQIADDILLDRRSAFHQRQLAAELGVSLGNVNLALEPLRAVGAVAVVGKTLVVRDVKKLLAVWAARRDPLETLVAFAASESPPALIRLLPPGLALTSFAGYVARYGEGPAPFSVVRAYVRPGDDVVLAELARRFDRTADLANASLAVHAADPLLARDLPEVVGPAQLYVDLWAEADFFASDYLRALETRLRL